MEKELPALVTEVIEKEFTQEKVFLLLVEDKLKQSYDIQLTKKQKKDLELNFEKRGLESLNQLNINLNRAQISYLKKTGHSDLILDFTESDFDTISKKIEGASTVATDAIVNYLSDALVKEWKKGVPGFLKKSKLKKRNFMGANYQIWGKPIDLLEALISISLEAGNDFNQKFKPTNLDENNVVFEAVTRLHVRGCQVGSEIVVLLRNGFADGSHARWRTLYEISVIAQFVASHDNSLAERYLDHSIIADYQGALQYKEYCSKLSYAPLSDDDFNKIKSSYDNVLEKYPQKSAKNKNIFKGDYGWASEVLNNKSPNFSQIEEKAGVSHMQPFVKLAHLNIHAGSKGIITRLGSPTRNPDLLLAGPSIYGIGEPGQNTAYSMFLLTSALLHINPNLDNFGFILALRKLMDDVVWEFDRVMAEQESVQ